MILNDAGKIIGRWWNELKNKYANIEIDEYVIMPNHCHGIINIVGTGRPIYKMVQWFKTMTSNEYIRNVKQNHWEPFEGKLWQRNYYEQIVRDEISLRRIREYIVNNPYQWQKDKLFVG
ncbi:MAG: transposase [Phycisphaerae bacterium]